MAGETVSEGKARGDHDANRHGATPPELSTDTRETELLPQNASGRTDSFGPVENISLEGFHQLWWFILFPGQRNKKATMRGMGWPAGFDAENDIFLAVCDSGDNRPREDLVTEDFPCVSCFIWSEKELSLRNPCCGDGGGGRTPNCSSDLILPNARDEAWGEDEEKPCSGAVGRRSAAPPCPASPRFQLSRNELSLQEAREEISPGLSVSDPTEATPESTQAGAGEDPGESPTAPGGGGSHPPRGPVPRGEAAGPGRRDTDFPFGLTLQLKVIHNIIFVTARNTWNNPTSS